MLISAAVGAGTGAAGSAISGGDPLKGALTGAALGAVTGGVGAGFGGAASTGANIAGTASESALNAQIANEALIGSAVPAGAPVVPGFGVIPPDAGLTAAAASAPPTTGTQLGIDAISGNPITAPQNQISSGINTLNNAGSIPVANVTGPNLTTWNGVTADNLMPPTPSTTPTYEFAGAKGNLTSSANAPSKGLFGYEGPTPNVFQYGPQSNMALGGIGATSGISAAMQAERDKFKVPEQEKYTGPLSRFKYDPSTYNPDVVRPPNPPYRAVYAAEGGIMSLAPNGYAMGGVPTRPPQTNFANPSSYEEGTSQYSMATDPMSGNIANRMAEGGITSLGSYSDGGRLLKGPGDGMSDNIPARIGRKQEARLADGEFVVPADVVSHLGNGSTDAGAKTLYAMMNKVRKARTGTKKQGRQIQASSYLPA
jgi:hypothetical protein